MSLESGSHRCFPQLTTTPHNCHFYHGLLGLGVVLCDSVPAYNHTTQQSDTKNIRQMEVTVKACDENSYVIEVGVDDTTETMRQKVASAVGLAEDSFHMGFGGKDEGEDITQLSAGDTINLTKTQKYEAIAALHALGERNITPERLEEVEDPEVACLLLQAEVATVIPKGFLSGSSLTTLDLSALSCVSEVGDEFVYGCTTLTNIDLSGLTRLDRIGSKFIANCKNLTVLHLPPCSNVTQLEGFFLLNCTSLTAVDLSALRNVREIAKSFLGNCCSLNVLDLSPLISVARLGSNFLSYCMSLKVLDLSPLSNVTEIGPSFLARCRSLRAVHVSPLNVTQISERFLYACTSLKVLDVSPLSNVTQINEDFLYDCSSLTVLDLSPLSNVTKIGPSFLANCNGLSVLDLSPLSNVTEFAPLRAEHYTSLRSIHLAGCSSVVSSRVREGNWQLRKLVAEERPKRSRDESPEHEGAANNGRV